jgi:transposase
MRGRQPKQVSLVSLTSPESVVPAEHPLRSVKKLADAALEKLSPVFEEMYAGGGRPSVPPERLLKGMLLIALYTVRSERMFCEQLNYNLLFKWFLDMDLDEPAFDATTFGKNRDRLLQHEVAQQFFAQVVEQARQKKLLSAEHFSVDGTLIEAWASMKSFRRKDDDDDQDSNGWSDFRGEPRSNETHESKTDPDAKLMRKGRGREAKLSYCINALIENRHGLLVGLQVDLATGRAERNGALEMLDRDLPGDRQITLGADRAYDTRGFVDELRHRNVTPHVAQNISGRTSAIDARTTRHPGYAASSIRRRLIEPVFGWLKGPAGLRKTRYRGKERTNLWSVMAGAAFNLMRIAKLIPV